MGRKDSLTDEDGFYTTRSGIRARYRLKNDAC